VEEPLYFVDFLREPVVDEETGETVDAHPSFYESVPGGLAEIRAKVEALQRRFNEESKVKSHTQLLIYVEAQEPTTLICSSWDEALLETCNSIHCVFVKLHVSVCGLAYKSCAICVTGHEAGAGAIHRCSAPPDAHQQTDVHGTGQRFIGGRWGQWQAITGKACCLHRGSISVPDYHHKGEYDCSSII
jgi:hypothetical protein